MSGAPVFTGTRVPIQTLLDECVDWRLSRELQGHEVRTARKTFDVFVTVDRKLPSQQNLSVLAIAVVVSRARTNRLADLRPLIPNLLVVLPRAKPRTATVVEA